MRRMLPDSAAEATARKLAEILQTSESSRTAQELLLQAHRRADQLLDLGDEPASDWHELTQVGGVASELCL